MAAVLVVRPADPSHTGLAHLSSDDSSSVSSSAATRRASWSNRSKPKTKRPPKTPKRIQRGGPVQLRWRLATAGYGKATSPSSNNSHPVSDKGTPPSKDLSSPSGPGSSPQGSSLLRQVGNGIADPFSTSPIPVNHFLHHLLPLAKRSYLFDRLAYILPNHPNPGEEWIHGMLSQNTHAAYLYAYGVAQRVPQVTAPRQSHIRAHLGSALATMRQALQQGEYNETLAELNVMLAAHAFYSGKIDEWLAHTLACRDIINKIGGLSSVSPLFRSVILIAGAVACGRVLLHPTFASSDFNQDVDSLHKSPALQLYAPNIDLSMIAIENEDLRGLFHDHQEYHQVYREYRNHFIVHPIHHWLDRRFHQLNIISLEVYFKVYKMNPVSVSEDQRIRTQINGILTLALTYLHQYIYHCTRQIGEQDIASPWSPFLTIFFEHLRSHLKRLFEFHTYDVRDDPAPILWAVFVLVCNERLRSERNRLLRAGSQQENDDDNDDDEWATSVFYDILDKTPQEKQNFKDTKALFQQYLYDDLFDDFLKDMIKDCQ